MHRINLRNTYNILSLDGGGVRGIYSASLLSYVEQQIGPLSQHFDLITGTSTGAILALAIADDVQLERVVGLYLERAPHIFRSVPIVTFLKSLLVAKYDASILIDELQAFFGRDRTIGDLKNRVCIPSVELGTGQTKVFKTQHSERYIIDYKRKIWEVAAASSSAPYFFNPHEASDGYRYIDGGLWANNPSLVGIAEAVRLGIDVSKVRVLSIGTCSRPFYRPNNSKKLGGLIGWTQIAEAIMSSQSIGAGFTTEYLLGKENVLRIDGLLPDNRKWLLFKRYKLDSISDMPSLRMMGQKAGENYLEAIKQFLQ